MLRYLMALASLILVGCANQAYWATTPPNYDRYIGQRFDDAIFKGSEVYRVVRETETTREFQRRRSDGCVLVFGVRKGDDVIQYWRVDSGPDTCKVAEKLPHV